MSDKTTPENTAPLEGQDPESEARPVPEQPEAAAQGVGNDGANKEPQTVNDEFQQRNAALVRTGNDLNNLLMSVDIPVLMLSSKLEVRQFTPPMQCLIHLRPSDIGRPVNEIAHNLSIVELQPLVQEVLETLATREIEVQDRQGRWYMLRVRPYRTSDNKIEGAVLVMLDIDQLRRTQEELRAARDFAVSVIESVQVPVAVLSLDLKFRTVNSAFRAFTGMPAAELDGRSMPEVAEAHWGMEGLRERLEWLRDDPSGAGIFEVEHEIAPGRRVVCVRGRKLQANDEGVLLLILEDMTDRRRGERLLASAADELERTEEQLRALTASLFRSQEDERRRVARELHDDISQKLALLDMEMKQVEDSLGDAGEVLRSRIESLRQRAGALADDVRRISRGLHPSILDDLGLSHALRALVEDFGKREQMLASFYSRNVPEELPHELGGTLYRMAQEALRNIAKHAGKTHVKVSLEFEDGKVLLEVADLGEGFDPADAHRGLGLIGMAERARLIGGRFSVRSALGKGTTVTVEAPIPAEPEG